MPDPLRVHNADSPQSYHPPDSADASPDGDADYPEESNGAATSSSTDPAAAAADDTDNAMAIGVGRALRSTLRHLAALTELETGGPVVFSGSLKIHIANRSTYSIPLSQASDDPKTIKVQNDRHASGDKIAGEKRQRDNPSDAQNGGDSDSKRRRRESIDYADHGQDEDIMGKLANISEQIRWVEECRRISHQHNMQREENWRSTSAVWHDEVRRSRESHEAWVAQELAWQRAILNQIANDCKANTVVSQSLKWETPPNLAPASPPIPKPPGEPRSEKVVSSSLKWEPPITLTSAMPPMPTPTRRLSVPFTSPFLPADQRQSTERSPTTAD
jgi:hypothetical protein